MKYTSRGEEDDSLGESFDPKCDTDLGTASAPHRCLMASQTVISSLGWEKLRPRQVVCITPEPRKTRHAVQREPAQGLPRAVRAAGAKLVLTPVGLTWGDAALE